MDQCINAWLLWKYVLALLDLRWSPAKHLALWVPSADEIDSDEDMEK